MQRVKRWHIGLVFLLLIVAFVATVVVMRGDSSKEKGMISHGDHSHESEADLWTCSMHPFIVVDEPGDCPVCAMDLVPKKKEEAPKGPQERVIAYWRAPMNPKEVYNAPGKSAMGMELVPVYEDELVGGVVISIDPVVEQNMGVRLTEARRSALTRRVRTWGNVTFDETQTFGISPRFSGWIQKLWIHYEGQPVKKGDPLYAVYSPELIAAQQEYLNARRSHAIAKGDTQKRLLDSARRKLINYGISDSEIRRSEALGRALESVTLTSPYKGVVTSTMAVEGGFFKAGASLFTISDLSRIWAEARIYEYEVPQVTVGQRAVVELPFEKGRKLEGAVTFVAPVMQGETRDLSVRLEFENRDGLLKPGM
ncbi:MAG: efflux RND transporter periplasmic adaptor subunit, partial [Desulfobacterales bacterium]|nr:efflux RND transporter periplasmic adaptor subunit [Desulfobacterales bacterium]